MGSDPLILKLILFVIAVDVTFALADLQSFQLCIVDQGLPPDLIIQHSTGNSSLYAELNHRWNVRPVHVHPLAYFVPRATSDVQVAVRCARANNIPVIPKSGGHSAELLSFGNAGTIVITFQNMKNIEINASEKTAVIESGALLGEIRQKLLNEGGFGLSSGNCDDVGIGGITLGGGDGASTAIHNLTIDNILEMEMVDSNGDLHLVNENINPDLFWALRGIGSGYIGIVTTFKFKLFNATDLWTTRVTFTYDLENIRQVFLAHQEWMLWAEREGLIVRTLFNIFGDSQTTLNTILYEEISKGQPTNSELFINKAHEIFPQFESRKVTLDFPTYAELKSDDAKMELFSINARVQPATFVKKKSFFITHTYSAEELEKLFQTFLKGKNLPFMFVTFGYTGPWNKIPATDMSFVHRGHLYWVSTRIVASAQISYQDAQIALDYLNELQTECKVLDSGESYQNYVDLDLDNFMERYYGINSQRLIEIKRKWDPDNYFQNEHSIPIGNVAAKSNAITGFFLVLVFVLCNYEILKFDLILKFCARKHI